MKEQANSLNKTFADFIPNWGEISPSDPTKILAEGISASFSALQNQSQQMALNSFHMLPTLLGIKRQRPKLAQVLLQCHLREDQKKSLSLPEEAITEARLDANNEISAQLFLKAKTLHPFRLSQTDKGLELIPLSSGDITCPKTLTFWHLPNQEDSSREQMSSELTLIAELQEQREEIILKEADLMIKDETQGLGLGQLEITLTDDVFQALKSKPLKSLKLQATQEKLQRGQWFFNCTVAALAKREEAPLIGTLKGDIWEELTLDQDLFEVPRSLKLLTLSGLEHHLTLFEGPVHRELLPENCYLYDQFHHKLIFPHLHSLLDQETGHASVHSDEGIRVISVPKDLDQMSVHSSEWSEFFHGFEVIHTLSSEQLREGMDEFHSRVQDHLIALKSLSPLKESKEAEEESKAEFSLASLRHHIRLKHPNITSCEINNMEQGKILQVFIALREREIQTLENSTEFQMTAQSIRELLIPLLPLDLAISVHPFQRSDLDIDFYGECTTKEEKPLGKDFSTHLKELQCEIKLFTQKGEFDGKILLAKDKTLEKLQELCTSFLEKRGIQVSTASMSCLKNKHHYLSEFQRNKGELYQVQVSINFERETLSPLEDQSSELSDVQTQKTQKRRSSVFH